MGVWVWGQKFVVDGIIDEASLVGEKTEENERKNKI